MNSNSDSVLDDFRLEDLLLNFPEADVALITSRDYVAAIRTNFDAFQLLMHGLDVRLVLFIHKIK